jgi:hypothetical protein
MSTATWRQVPPVAVDPREIVPTQGEVMADRMLAGGTVCGDVYPHVVRFAGRLWLDDGHHRVAQAIRLGIPLIAARLLAHDAC